LWPKANYGFHEEITNKDERRMKQPKNFDENLDSYEVFYLEIPKADYMDDIEIQDEYDNPDQELTTDESSDYTRASLEAAKDQQVETEDDSAK
jgi:hypothetical protein